MNCDWQQIALEARTIVAMDTKPITAAVKIWRMFRPTETISEILVKEFHFDFFYSLIC